MQWSDVVAPPSPKVLRQFAGVGFVVFNAIAGWRWFRGDTGGELWALAAVAVVLGLLGLVFLPAVGVIYRAWMIVAFPIGWTVSRVVLLVMFYLVFTPIGLWFRMTGRDALKRQRRRAASYWTAKATPADAADYLRQY